MKAANHLMRNLTTDLQGHKSPHRKTDNIDFFTLGKPADVVRQPLKIFFAGDIGGHCESVLANDLQPVGFGRSIKHLCFRRGTWRAMKVDDEVTID